MRLSPVLFALGLSFPLGASAQQAKPVGEGVVPLPPVTLPRTHAPRPTSAAITAADLMTRLYIFSDDSMQGREAGTAGNVKGTDYIAGEARRIGLVPAGDNGTYFQTIPLKTRSFDSTSSFTVNGTPLAVYSDYVVLSRGPEGAKSGLPVVYGGELGDTSSTLIAPEAAAGKLVVFAVKGGFNALRVRRTRIPAVDSAAASAIVALDDLPARFLAFFKRPATFVDDPSREEPAGREVLLISKAAAGHLFSTPFSQLAPGASGGTASLDLKYRVEPVEFPARNVVGIVRGRDPKLRGEYVAIGAHNDHIGMTGRPVDHDSIRIFNHLVRPEGADDAGNQATPEQQAAVDAELAAYRAAHPGSDRPDSISNGADDDGSGTVTVLEIAQKIASLPVKPKRSILFVWHVGEEKGLLGSRYFTDHPTVPRDSIVAQLNMDMVGRGDASDETGRTKAGAPIHGSPNYLQLVGSRRLSTELGDLVEAVNRSGGHHMTLDYSIDADGHPANIYCRSDHYEYARYGIPIVFFTTGLHSDYHQVTDEPEYIDYAHMARVGNFVEDIALHVANLNHRVVVDHPKPDPNGACRQ